MQAERVQITINKNNWICHKTWQPFSGFVWIGDLVWSHHIAYNGYIVRRPWEWGITCVIECFRVLAYYILLTFLFCICLVSPSIFAPFFSVSTLLSNYKLHIVRLSCPPPPRRLQVGGWCVGERRKKKNADCTGERRGLVIEIDKVRFLISSSTWAGSTKAPDAVFWNRHNETPFYLFQPPRQNFIVVFSTPLQPASFNGRSELFCFFAYMLRGQRIFFTPTNSSSSSSPHDAQPNVTEAR